MIEKWLREKIDSMLCYNKRIVVLDTTLQWEFLVDAACVNLCLLKRTAYDSNWQRKQEELFLRYEAEKNHADSAVVFYIPGEIANDSFLAEYARTGGCIELSTEWVRNVILKKTTLQVSLGDEELYSACHVGIEKDLNWWKRIVQRIDSILLLEDDIYNFLDDPKGFMARKSPVVNKLYTKEFCKLLGQPEQEKPADTFANEIAKHIFDGILNGSMTDREYAIYCKWIDSREHEAAFKKYLSNYKIPKGIEIDRVNDNHCFETIDKKYLVELVENINDTEKVKKILSKIKKRLKYKNKNPYIAKWWPDVTNVMSFSIPCKGESIDEISHYYTMEFASQDRSMRRLLSYLKAEEKIIRPLQEHYERMNQDLLKVWFAHYGEYKESQKGYLVRLIKNSSKKIAIIVGDGIRYEMADSVASRLDPTIITEKKFMYAGLPSETEHNMSALYTTEGKVITDKSEREKILSKEAGKEIIYLQLEDVNETTEGEILVLTYKDIDDAGEKMQQSMLRLVKEFEDLLIVKIQLLLHMGYKEVHFVTDHGFVLTGVLDEADKIPTDDIAGDKKVSERYIRSVEEQTNEMYISIKEPYGEYNYVNFAKSSRPFYSTGKYGYSHGGFTPQEVVI
ncbi:MAG TPA: hypothetical protein DE117_02245, partial [Fervidobacterium sp.]|nr:hypothetical protein [Fervidobacterium sp.]